MRIFHFTFLLPLALLLAACGDDRRGAFDAGMSAMDAGAADDGGGSEDGGDGGDGMDAGFEGDAGMEDAGPAVGSCLGSCAAPLAAECPAYDRPACNEQCLADQTAAEAAGCGEEYSLFLGCRQISGYACDAEGQPFTDMCGAQEAAYRSCIEG